MMAHAMTDRQYEVTFVHYACKGYTVSYKAKALELSKKNYYQLLDRAQNVLMRCFSPVNETVSPP